MTKFDIQLASIQDVREFVEIVTMCDVEIDLTSGRYIVDAKSIMGIFSLDLMKPIGMNIHSDDCSDIVEKLSKFIVK